MIEKNGDSNNPERGKRYIYSKLRKQSKIIYKAECKGTRNIKFSNG